MEYYSERHGIRKQREKTYDVSIEAYNLILEIIERYLVYLAWKFPERCPDNDANICGIDEEKHYRDLRFEIPGLFKADGFNIPKRHYNVFEGKSIDEYNQYSLLDYIEYMFKNMKDCVVKGYHKFFSHNHYAFVAGKKSVNAFRNEINQTFEKVGLLYTLNDKGQVERIVENESLLKTVETQVENVSEKALLEDEFSSLTKIGNNYRIRHHETDKIEITDINHYEYFFNRCLSAISFVLKYLK